jgi:hypothetical protein
LRLPIATAIATADRHCDSDRDCDRDDGCAEVATVA